MASIRLRIKHQELIFPEKDVDLSMEILVNRDMDKFERYERIELYADGNSGLVIQQWPDAPTAIEACNIGDHFGKFSFIFSVEQARQMAKALVDIADRIDEQD